jgi:hypothetical protein
MNQGTAVIYWLRGLHRGFKFAILLVAAWAPFMFPSVPWVGGVLMASMTALFFVATGSKVSMGIATPENSEAADAES